MKPIYEVIEEPNQPIIIKRTDEDSKEWWIPSDPANSDYQAYLKSLDETASL